MGKFLCSLKMPVGKTNFLRPNRMGIQMRQFSKYLRTACFYLLWAKSGLASSFFSIPADYDKINSPPPELAVTDPFPTIDNRTIRGVKFSIDGSWYEYSCTSEDRNSDRTQCGKAVQVQPGPHIFYALLCTDKNCSIVGEAWKFHMKLNVGVRESVKISLTKLANLPPKVNQNKALERKTLSGTKRNACVKAVESAFYVNTCDARGIGLFRKRLNNMHKVCSKTWSKNTDLLLELATWQVAWLQPGRCYSTEETKKMPDFLTSWRVSDRFWPPGTVKDGMSSWAWARENGSSDLFSKYSGPKFRKEIRERLKVWQARQTVVDELIGAVLDPKNKLPFLIAAAKKNKFDMNPTNPIGHRNFGMATLFPENKDIAALMAKATASSEVTSGNSQIHCALRPEITRLIDSFTNDKELTAIEWKAALELFKKTPSDQSMRECLDLARASMKSSIPLVTRLSDFAKFDCDKNRIEKVRGNTISDILQPGYLTPAIPDAVRFKVMRAYPDCIGWESASNNELNKTIKYKTFTIEREFYGTGDLRAMKIYEGEKSNEYVNLYYRVGGQISRVMCDPPNSSYLYKLEECQKHFKIDLKKAKTFK